jgi:hypothetical protein
MNLVFLEGLNAVLSTSCLFQDDEIWGLLSEV